MPHLDDFFGILNELGYLERFKDLARRLSQELTPLPADFVIRETLLKLPDSVEEAQFLKNLILPQELSASPISGEIEQKPEEPAAEEHGVETDHGQELREVI